MLDELNRVKRKNEKLKRENEILRKENEALKEKVRFCSEKEKLLDKKEQLYNDMITNIKKRQMECERVLEEVKTLRKDIKQFT